MNYTLTPADIATITIVVGFVVIMLLSWPTADSKAPPNYPRERSYVIGANAFRTAWDHKTGHHEMMVELNRMSDAPPHVGDLITFIETDKSVFRGVVVDVQCIVQLHNDRPRAVLTIGPMMRGGK